MPLTNFPNGITSFGVPVIGSGSIPTTTGNYWFVNSGNTTQQDGTTPQTAFLTVAQAVSASTASNGDVVVIMPGHAESISSATSFGSLSKAGVTFVGLGAGSSRPTFTYTTAVGATINVTAANVTFQNCVFVANFADVAAAFTTTTAKNLRLIDCEFRDNSSILNFVVLVDTNATSNDTDGLSLIRSNWYGLTATANSAVIKMDGTNSRVSVVDGYFAHAALTAAGFMPIASGKVVTNLICRRNVFNLVGATNLATGLLITTDGSTNSGIIADNYIQNLDATTEILVTASSGFIFSQNFYSGVADKSGYLLPAADA